MKTRFLAWVALLVVATGSVKAQLYDQWASMEFKQWSFSPDKYYYSRKWGTIINMPWPLPDIKGWKGMEHGYMGYHDKGLYEELTHLYLPINPNPYTIAAGHWDAAYQPDNYVNENWRQQLGLRTPAAAESVLYKLESNKEEEYWSNIRELDVVTIADRSGVLSGLTGAATVTASERQEAMDAVNESYDNIKGTFLRELLMKEYNSLQEKVSVIDNAHMDNARKLVALQDINREWQELKKMVTDILNWQKYDENNKKYMGDMEKQYKWVRDMFKDSGSSGKSSIMKLVNLDKL